MNITAQVPISDLAIPLLQVGVPLLQVGEEFGVAGTARVVGIKEKLEVNVYPGDPDTSAELVVTLALEVWPA